jgi:outer membrane lipoprotein-sorting protein
MQPIDGKVFFKKPAKFKIRTKGIVFLPKQNPYYSLSALADTNSYTAVNTGEEKIGKVTAVIIQVLPNGGDNDLILGKFWIDKINNIVLRSQLTTKSAGTLLIDNSYGTGSSVAYALPDRMTISVDMAKFKVPKMISADINNKSTHTANEPQKGTGVITLTYSGYAINQKVPDSVFADDVK